MDFTRVILGLIDFHNGLPRNFSTNSTIIILFSNESVSAYPMQSL